MVAEKTSLGLISPKRKYIWFYSSNGDQWRDSASVQDMDEESQLADRGFSSWLGHKLQVFPDVLLLSHKERWILEKKNYWFIIWIYLQRESFPLRFSFELRLFILEGRVCFNKGGKQSAPWGNWRTSLLWKCEKKKWINWWSILKDLYNTGL